MKFLNQTNFLTESLFSETVLGQTICPKGQFIAVLELEGDYAIKSSKTATKWNFQPVYERSTFTNLMGTMFLHRKSPNQIF